MNFDTTTCDNPGCGYVFTGWGHIGIYRQHRRRCDRATVGQREQWMALKRKVGRRIEWNQASLRDAR